MNQFENFEQIRDFCVKYLYDADLRELGFREADEIYFSFIIGGDDETDHLFDVHCRGIHVFNVAKDPRESFADGFVIANGRVAKFEDELSIKKTLKSAGWKFYDKLPNQVFQFEVENAIEIIVILSNIATTVTSLINYFALFHDERRNPKV